MYRIQSWSAFGDDLQGMLEFIDRNKGERKKDVISGVKTEV